jgi:hypothetical protein
MVMEYAPAANALVCARGVHRAGCIRIGSAPWRNLSLDKRGTCVPQPLVAATKGRGLDREAMSSMIASVHPSDEPV